MTLIAANPALQLGPFVIVDPNPENGVAGPNIVFTGANIHIINGAGSTQGFYGGGNGLGNLIIGYDEVPAYQMSTIGGPPLPPGIPEPALSYTLRDDPNLVATLCDCWITSKCL